MPAAIAATFRPKEGEEGEQIVLLRRLWSEPLVSFEGRDRIDRAGI